MSWRLKSAVMAAVLLATGPLAHAQKAKDTLRVAVYQPISMVDVIYNPHPETSVISNIVYDSLVIFDPVKRDYKPLLAESWKRIDDKTVEFKLRHNIKFHDGTPFTADDVVYSFSVYMDPKYNFRFKDTRFDTLAKVEKIDDFTVRVTTKQVYAPFFMRMGMGSPIYPKHIYEPLENKGDFGRHPVGTGPYKVVSFDATKGEVVYQRNDDYAMKDVRPAGSVKNIIVSSIPDQQTQVAKLMSGQLDVMLNVPSDMAPSLSANPNIKIDSEPTVSYSYIEFDTLGRSGIEVFKDKRVRQAVLKAINRPAMLKAFLPPEMANDPPQIAMCNEWHVGCAASVKPLAYDPEGAKKLLAEAGYPNGFDLTIGTWGAAKQAAEAVVGQLKLVGINAKLDAMPVGVYVKKRGEGQLQTLASFWDNGVGEPDIDGTMSFFFSKSSRDYIGDPVLQKAVEDGQHELDVEKRQQIYKTAFDRVTTEAYMMPLVPIPAIVAHSKEVKLLPGQKNPEGIELNYIGWN